MTRTEDIVRVRSIDANYLNARIEALENRVQYLEQIIEVEYLNEE
jgi:hypothetical protein|tara:strand:+ start:562 stop:696 length:135 start_codon:yes stop_codon:yes gene_type:complete